MDKDAAITWLEQIRDKIIRGGDEDFDGKRREAINMGIEAISNSRPVSYWEKISNDDAEQQVYVCLTCGRTIKIPKNIKSDSIAILYPFCHCGADMRYRVVSVE